MATTHTTASPAPREPRGDRSLARLRALPADLRVVLGTVSATTRCTTTEALDAAEALVWLSTLATWDDLADALVRTIRDRRAGRVHG